MVGDTLSGLVHPQLNQIVRNCTPLSFVKCQASVCQASETSLQKTSLQRPSLQDNQCNQLTEQSQWPFTEECHETRFVILMMFLLHIQFYHIKSCWADMAKNADIHSTYIESWWLIEDRSGLPSAELQKYGNLLIHWKSSPKSIRSPYLRIL